MTLCAGQVCDADILAEKYTGEWSFFGLYQNALELSRHIADDRLNLRCNGCPEIVCTHR